MLKASSLGLELHKKNLVLQYPPITKLNARKVDNIENFTPGFKKSEKHL